MTPEEEVQLLRAALIRVQKSLDGNHVEYTELSFQLDMFEVDVLTRYTVHVKEPPWSYTKDVYKWIWEEEEDK